MARPAGSVGVIVLHVIPGLGRSGGAERSLASTAPALVEGLDEYHVVLLTGRDDLVGDLRSAGVIVHDLSGARGLFGRVRAIRRLIRRVDPTVVHSTLFDADVATCLAVGRSRPLICTWANTPFAEGARVGLNTKPWKLTVIKWVEVALGRYAGATYQAVTPGVARSNAASLRVPAQRVFVAERGRPEPSSCDEAIRSECREELGVSAGEPMMLAVARHEPQKDLASFLRTVATVRDRLGAGQGVIVGRTGSETEALEALLVELGLSDAVHLTGARSDVGRFMCAADMLVLTSRSEGAAGVVIEAMAHRLPIVATTVAGLEGVLENEKNSLTAPVGDLAALAAASLRVLDDPEFAAGLALSARATYEERFTTVRSADSLLDMYRQVAAQP